MMICTTSTSRGSKSTSVVCTWTSSRAICVSTPTNIAPRDRRSIRSTTSGRKETACRCKTSTGDTSESQGPCKKTATGNTSEVQGPCKTSTGDPCEV